MGTLEKHIQKKQDYMETKDIWIYNEDPFPTMS